MARSREFRAPSPSQPAFPRRPGPGRAASASAPQDPPARSWGRPEGRPQPESLDLDACYTSRPVMRSTFASVTCGLVPVPGRLPVGTHAKSG